MVVMAVANLGRVESISMTLVYEAGRKYRMSTEAPSGTVLGPEFASLSQATEAAKALAAHVRPDAPEIEVNIRISKPPWLSSDQFVTVVNTSSGEAELGWIGAFVDGGVYVNGLESGGGIYAPEEIDDAPILSAEQINRIESSRQQNIDILRTRATKHGS